MNNQGKSAVSFCSMLVVLLLAAACQLQEGSSEYAAQEEGAVLRWEEVAAQIPKGISKSDSLALSKNIIRDWRLRKNWLSQAESQMGNDLDSFEVVVQRYREDLLILTYRNQLAQQKVDTNVSNQELRTWYTQASKQLKLSKDIVRVSYLALPMASRWTSSLKREMAGAERGPSESLVAFSKKWARQYRLGDTTWVEISELVRQLGVPAFDPNQMLTRGYKEWTMGSTRYVVYVHEVRRAESTLPFDLAKPWIRAMVVDARKKKFWSELEQNMIEED
jgi:hypothetical protein